MNALETAARITPSPRQMAWQKLEFTAFFHFGVNTFTDREWGDGSEDPAIFAPSALDALQWVRAVKAAGMKGVILTCKHHDGFCLWPSKLTEHSVKNSPYQEGNGDVVRDVSLACAKEGLKFGVYLSPWDRHEACYGDSDAYNDYFCGQLRELLTQYGPIYCVWFDGACGEGPNGKRQVYDWERYYALIRDLQPEAVISVCGPDVRWCGNEAGHCRENEWSVVPAALRSCEMTAEKSQKIDDGEFARSINSMQEDLGSREAIANAPLCWYPAEVNTSIRPGWFYHAHEDDKVKSVQTLINVYENAVGGNAVFLLNMPPDRRGLIHENDVATLAQMGKRLQAAYQNNLLKGSQMTAAAALVGHLPQNLWQEERETDWAVADETLAVTLEIDLPQRQTLDTVVLMEKIEQGQRVEAFTLDVLGKDGWQTVFNGGVIGYKKICHFEEITAQRLRLSITQSRLGPRLCFMGIYHTQINAK